MTSATAMPFAPSPELREDLRRIFGPLLAAGVILSGASIIGGFTSPGDFFYSYLMSFLFWFGLTLGSMAIVMLQYLTAGAWGIMARRPLESASRTLWLCALLFIPIALGTSKIYDWAHPGLVHNEYALAHRQPYMSPRWFVARAAAYFIVWGIFTYFLNRWSTEQDKNPGLENVFEKRLARLSAPGLVLYVFTLTFAAVDWAASLETDWSSTIWGFIFVAQQVLSVFAFAIVVLVLLSRRQPMAGAFRTQHMHDLGNLTLTCLMLWAYFEFSQLVIVWAGNLTDEIPWYMRRLATTWGWLGVALIVIQFILPFLALLSRKVKRNIAALCTVVGVIIVMRWVDLAWVVLPSYYHKGLRVTWLMICVPLAMGCFWVAAYIWNLKNRPLLPINAPNLERALRHGE
jgi:hypothetical protein